jgi:hypothetical protein
LVAVACFLPGRAKDLTAARYGFEKIEMRKHLSTPHLEKPKRNAYIRFKNL